MKPSHSTMKHAQYEHLICVVLTFALFFQPFSVLEFSILQSKWNDLTFDCAFGIAVAAPYFALVSVAPMTLIHQDFERSSDRIKMGKRQMDVAQCRRFKWNIYFNFRAKEWSKEWSDEEARKETTDNMPLVDRKIRFFFLILRLSLNRR